MLITSITRERAISWVKRWHAAPRMKSDSERVSARHVPHCQWIFDDVGGVGAIDNSQGRMEAEVFPTLDEATDWLRRAQ